MNMYEMILIVMNVNINLYKMEQKDFLELAHAWNSIDMNGVAGSGKTFVLKQFINEALDLWKNVVVVAPTGVAAINIWGATIHSTFKISWDNYYEFNSQKVQWREINVLVIDEKSMIGPDLLDHMSNIISKNVGDIRPFGWLQVIFCGDMKQLPPVYKITKENVEQHNILKVKYWMLVYSSSFAFKNLKIKTIELTTMYRQKDPILIDILNKVRAWDKFAAFEIKKWTFSEQQSEESIHIMPYNDMVDKFNINQYNKIKWEEKVFVWEVTWKFNIANVLSPLKLALKKWVRVMLTKNDLNIGIYNWDLWTVTSIDWNNIKILFDRPWVWNMTISEVSWEQKEFNETSSATVWEFKQIPLRLAYAITTHKSQWLSLDKVIVHYVHGMSDSNFYTALSRATNLENLFLA